MFTYQSRNVVMRVNRCWAKGSRQSRARANKLLLTRKKTVAETHRTKSCRDDALLNEQ